MPPKSIFTSAQLHYTSTPSLLSCAFCGNTTIVYVAGRHLCFFDVLSEQKEFVPLPEGVYAAKCLATTSKFVALATSGIFPCIYVFEDRKLKFVIPKVAELDVPDLQFSACGGRLFALGKSSTATRLLVYNTVDGSLLPGCENVTSLARYQLDRLFVSPIDKDRVYVCNSARRVAQLVRIARRFKRYLVTIYDNSIPELGDGEMLSPLEGYSWTPKGRFLVSTKSSVLLLCKDTGSILYTWRSLSAVEDERLVNGYITNMMFSPSFLIATHEVKQAVGGRGDAGSTSPVTRQYIVYWLYDQDEEDNAEGLADLFRMHCVCDLGTSNSAGVAGQRDRGADHGDGQRVPLAAADAGGAGGGSAALEEDVLGEAEDVSLDLKPLAKCHVNFVTSSCFVESEHHSTSGHAIVTGDETGCVQMVFVNKEGKPEVRTVRLQWGVQSIAAVGKDCIAVGTESGVLRILKLPNGDTVDCVRLSTLGFSRISYAAEKKLFAAAAYGREAPSVFLLGLVEKSLKCYGKVDLGAHALGVDDISCWAGSSSSSSASCVAIGGSSSARSPFRAWTWSFDAGNAAHLAQNPDGAEGVLGGVAAVPVKLDSEACSCAGGEDVVYIGYASGTITCLKIADIERAHEKVKLLIAERAAEPAAEEVVEEPANASETENAGEQGSGEQGSGAEGAAAVKQVEKVIVQKPEPPELIVSTLTEDGPGAGAFATPAHSTTAALGTDTMVAETVLLSHEQPIACLKVVKDPSGSVLLAAAAMDGCVLLVQRNMAVRSYQLADPFGGGVWSFALRPGEEGGGFYGLVTSSSEVCTFTTQGNAEGSSYVVTDWADLKLGKSVEQTGESETEMVVWSASGDAVDAAAAEESAEVVAANEASRRQLQSGLNQLRGRLQEFLGKNESAPELERLDRGQFCIDTEERDLLVRLADRKCEEVRDVVAKENLARRLIARRLVTEFWEPMKSPGAAVASLQGPQSVSNYPERKLEAAESQRMRMIAQLRDVELLEREYLGQQSGSMNEQDFYMNADKFLPPGMDRSYLINYFGGEELYATGGAAAETSGGEKKKLSEAEQKALADSKAIRDRVYTPFELTTNMRRKTQIVLLQTLSTDLQKAFNGKFAKCQGVKKEVMSHIKEKVERIRSILKELQIAEQVAEPELLGKEVPDSVLAVAEKEVSVAKWVSPEEKAKKAAEEKALAEKAANKTNDAGQRALQQMMGGRLKTNKDLTPLERVVDREPWMDEVPEEKWTELQQQLYSEYEQRCAALAAEQEAYKALLQTELAKLRLEVQELMTNFEAKLTALAGERHRADLHYYWQEIYSIRLFLALLQSVEDLGIKEFILAEIMAAKVRVQEAEAVMEEFAEKVRTHEKIQEEHVRREKELVSKFREHFPSLEAEQQSFLLKLFRQRLPKANTQALLDEGADHTVDYSGENIDTLHVPVLPDLPEETLRFPEDCQVEGIGKANFDLMLELKHQKMMLEAEITKLNGVHVEMVTLLEHYQSQVEQARAVFEKEVDDLRAHQSMIENEEEDYEIMLQLKQGQVEVPPAAVVTDYSDAVTFHKEVIEARNRRIIELGGEKVQILESVREFRKKINMVKWDQDMFDMQRTDLQERTKDVQFLRVTKDVQEIMSGGDEKKRQRQVELLEKKLEHVGKAVVQNVATMKTKYAKLSSEFRRIAGQNEKLSDELEGLVVSVNERTKIKNLQSSGGQASATPLHAIGKKKKTIGGGGAIAEMDYKTPNVRFAEARRRKTMQDRISNQEEELKVLRSELDRLRQKTFPSFVQVHEERGGIAD
eukprot:CAMPEP_0178994128 /NCGR_PEP_ID=MMETSP0795-20121207/7102_1 /TAXON_ID=88552 /ORGANISM="Amoebophrya sp., Strain Ameob2" /LENGTH=1787 /DNA_ID=CAMNT_0020686295 /DNA_START=224 /DNA_END=5589 /DNA_ORIENTATION=+